MQTLLVQLGELEQIVGNYLVVAWNFPAMVVPLIIPKWATLAFPHFQGNPSLD